MKRRKKKENEIPYNSSPTPFPSRKLDKWKNEEVKTNMKNNFCNGMKFTSADLL